MTTRKELIEKSIRLGGAVGMVKDEDGQIYVLGYMNGRLAATIREKREDYTGDPMPNLPAIMELEPRNT